MIDDIRARAEAVGWVADESTNGKLLIITDAPVSMDFPANFVAQWDSSDTSHIFLVIKKNKRGYQAALDLIEAEERRQARCEGCDGKGYTETTMESGMVIAKPCRGCKGTGERP